jgi:hypothetical protein
MLVLLFLSSPEAFRTGAYLNQEGTDGLPKKNSCFVLHTKKLNLVEVKNLQYLVQKFVNCPIFCIPLLEHITVIFVLPALNIRESLGSLFFINWFSRRMTKIICV